MSLTYDQKSEIRMAFDEAYVAPERRRHIRVKHQIEAEISPWKKGKHGEGFTVQIDDFSPTGVGLNHPTELHAGNQYLLKVPRPEMPELVVLLTVVRCVRLNDGTFQIGMELSSLMDRSAMGEFVDALSPPQQVMSRRIKILFVLLGIAGLGYTIVA